MKLPFCVKQSSVLLLSAAAPVRDRQLLPVVQDASESAEPDNPGINGDQPALQDCAIIDVGQQSAGVNLGTAMFYGTVRQYAASRKHVQSSTCCGHSHKYCCWKAQEM